MKNWLYFLTKEDGRSGYVSNGVVSFGNQRRPLPHTPDGWQDIMVAWERDLSKHGINRNFSVPLGFVRDGRRIIQHTLYNQSIEEKLFLLIQQLQLDYSEINSLYKFIYRYFYKGELDLTSVRDDPNVLTVSIAETGFAKLLKANENTIYEIPLDDPDSVLIKMDGVYLSQKHNFISQTGLYAGDMLLGALQTTTEGQAYGLASFSIFKQSEPGDLTTSLEYFLITPSPVSGIRIHGTIAFNSLALGTYTLKLKSSTGQDISLGSLADEGTISFDNTFNSAEDERFFLVLDSSSGVTAASIRETTFAVEYQSRKATTFVKAFKAITLFRKLIAKITGSESDAASTLLENDPGLCITCGDAIRGLAGAKIKTKLSDFTKNIDVNHMGGIGIEGGKIIIEDRLHFYDTSNPIDLGEATSLEISPTKDLFVNTIKVGHQDPSIEGVNGKYEFNGNDTFGTPVTAEAKELNIVSPYKSSPYEAEITRINLDGKESTDNDNDSDIFNIDVDPAGFTPLQVALTFHAFGNSISFPLGIDLQVGQVLQVTGTASNDNIYTILSVGNFSTQTNVLVNPIVVDEAGVNATVAFLSGAVVELKRETYDTITVENNGQVVSLPETIFNVRFTPKRILEIHKGWIRSLHHNMDMQKITFKSGTKNTTLITEKDGVTVDEDADMQIGMMGPKIFLPFYFDFTTKVPIDLVDVFESNPYRCFRLTWEGSTYLGFNVKSGLAPNNRAPQQFKLLSGPDNNPSNFIV